MDQGVGMLRNRSTENIGQDIPYFIYKADFHAPIYQYHWIYCLFF